MTKLLNWLVEKWEIDDLDKNNQNLVVPVSYGTHLNRLTNGSYAIINKAIYFSKQHPDALLAYGVFGFSTKGLMPQKEEVFRGQILAEAGVTVNKIIKAGLVSNTINEAQAIRKKLSEINHEQRTF